MLDELKKIIDEIEKRIEFDPSNEDNYKALIYSYPELGSLESRYLAKLYKKTNDKDIRNILFRCHLRYVYDICKKVVGYKPDLISEGNVLLLQELEKFDYNMDYVDFLKCLKQKLLFLYKSILNNTDAFLNTRMSTHDLACLEEHGKNLTEFHEENDNSDNKIKERKEVLIIVSDKHERNTALIKEKEAKKIFDSIFGDNKNTSKKYINKKYKPTDIDF